MYEYSNIKKVGLKILHYWLNKFRTEADLKFINIKLQKSRII
jgi:hypothetical protein